LLDGEKKGRNCFRVSEKNPPLKGGGEGREIANVGKEKEKKRGEHRLTKKGRKKGRERRGVLRDRKSRVLEREKKGEENDATIYSRKKERREKRKKVKEEGDHLPILQYAKNEWNNASPESRKKGGEEE